METFELFLDIHGVGVHVRSSDKVICEWLNFDFSYFVTTARPKPFLTIDAHLSFPETAIIPPLVESMHSPEYVCYDQGSKRYVDYHGKAMAVFDYDTETAVMYSDNPEFLYERLYLLLLSRVGEKLDRQGIHRVHSLGIAYRDSGALFLMPSRGGKSTLALSLLDEPDVSLLSEDTPLITTRGKLRCFPLRIGISREQIPEDAPENLVRLFERERWGQKALLNLEYFREKIEEKEIDPSFLFVGKWRYSDTPQIEKMSRFTAFTTLMRDCLFGLGLPQIVEYFLSMNKMDLLRKFRIVFLRLIAIISVTARTKPYRILLSRDIEANRKLVLKFLQERTAE